MTMSALLPTASAVAGRSLSSSQYALLPRVQLGDGGLLG